MDNNIKYSITKVILDYHLFEYKDKELSLKMLSKTLDSVNSIKETEYYQLINNNYLAIFKDKLFSKYHFLKKDINTKLKSVVYLEDISNKINIYNKLSLEDIYLILDINETINLLLTGFNNCSSIHNLKKKALNLMLNLYQIFVNENNYSNFVNLKKSNLIDNKCNKYVQLNNYINELNLCKLITIQFNCDFEFINLINIKNRKSSLTWFLRGIILNYFLNYNLMYLITDNESCFIQFKNMFISKFNFINSDICEIMSLDNNNLNKITSERKHFNKIIYRDIIYLSKINNIESRNYYLWVYILDNYINHDNCDCKNAEIMKTNQLFNIMIIVAFCLNNLITRPKDYSSFHYIITCLFKIKDLSSILYKNLNNHINVFFLNNNINYNLNNFLINK